MDMHVRRKLAAVESSRIESKPCDFAINGLHSLYNSYKFNPHMIVNFLCIMKLFLIHRYITSVVIVVSVLATITATITDTSFLNFASLFKINIYI